MLDAKLAPALRTYFNDSDLVKADCLREEFARLGGLDKLSHRPLCFNSKKLPLNLLNAFVSMQEHLSCSSSILSVTKR